MIFMSGSVIWRDLLCLLASSDDKSRIPVIEQVVDTRNEMIDLSTDSTGDQSQKRKLRGQGT